MKLADIEDYFASYNNWHLSPEEAAVFIAYLLITSVEGEISSQQITQEIRRGGYYNISINVLYKALRFLQDNNYCLTKLKKKDCDGKGRPEKLYCLPDDIERLRALQHIASFCSDLRPQSSLCIQSKSRKAELNLA